MWSLQYLQVIKVITSVLAHLSLAQSELLGLLYVPCPSSSVEYL